MFRFLIPIKTVIVHEDYNPRTVENDLTLLKLSKKVTKNKSIMYTVLTSRFRFLKGTADLVPSDATTKEWHVRFGTVFFKPVLLSNNEEDIECLKVFMSISFLHAYFLTHFFNTTRIEKNKSLAEKEEYSIHY